MFPLRHSCTHHPYLKGENNAHGRPVKKFGPDEPRKCFWWLGGSTEPQSGPVNSDRVDTVGVLVLHSDVPVDHRDEFTISGTRYAIDGKPGDSDHGPFGFVPKRRQMALKVVDGA